MSSVNSNSPIAQKPNAVEDTKDLFKGNYNKKQSKMVREIFCKSFEETSDSIRIKYNVDVKCNKQNRQKNLG